MNTNTNSENKAAGDGCCVSSCSLSSIPKGVVTLIKFMALRMLVGKDCGIDHTDISPDERELRASSHPNNGPIWFEQVALILACNDEKLSDSFVSKIAPLRPLGEDYLRNWITSMLGDVNAQGSGNTDGINKLFNAIRRNLPVFDQRGNENSGSAILDNVGDNFASDGFNDCGVNTHNYGGESSNFLANVKRTCADS